MTLREWILWMVTLLALLFAAERWATRHYDLQDARDDAFNEGFQDCRRIFLGGTRKR